MSDDRRDKTRPAFTIIDAVSERYLARDGGAWNFRPLPPADGGPFGDQVELPGDAWIGYRGETACKLTEVRVTLDPSAVLEEVDQDPD